MHDRVLVRACCGGRLPSPTDEKHSRPLQPPERHIECPKRLRGSTPLGPITCCKFDSNPVPQIVEDANASAGSDQGIGEVRPDKARASSHQASGARDFFEFGGGWVVVGHAKDPRLMNVSANATSGNMLHSYGFRSGLTTKASVFHQILISREYRPQARHCLNRLPPHGVVFKESRWVGHRPFGQDFRSKRQSQFKTVE